MMLLRISSRETFKATMTLFGSLWSAPNASTSSATRASSDMVLAMRISLHAEDPAGDGTEGPLAMDVPLTRRDAPHQCEYNPLLTAKYSRKCTDKWLLAYG